MKIKFLGAAKIVTGSCYLIETKDTSFLVDCGQFQGVMEEKFNTRDIDFDIKSLDFMILTHAHIDHSGRIPFIVKNGFNKKIFCTKPTSDLVSLLLKDSAHIHEEEIVKENKKRKKAGLEEIEPFYSVDDAFEAVQYLYPSNYNEIININDFIKIRFNEASHLLGSSFIEIWITENDKETKITFSGDLGSKDNPMLKPLEKLIDTDYLVLESTYGNRVHEGKEKKIENLANIIKDTFNRNGTVIIPSFSVGRTQELIYELKDYYISNLGIKEFFKIPIYVDSPLALEANKIFKDSSQFFNNKLKRIYDSGEDPLKSKNIKYIDSIKDSIKLNFNSESKIIISASGMCEGGRILNHLKYYLPLENTSIVFIGYQGEGTTGREILEQKKESVLINDEEVKINAKIFKISGFSGHADKNMILDWTNDINNLKKIIIVHGESDAQTNLKEELLNRNKGIDIIIPDMLDEIEL